MDTLYAQVLMRLIESGKSPEAALQALVEQLRTRGRLSLLPKIGRAFARQEAMKQRDHQVVVKVARSADEGSARRAAQRHAGESAATHVVVDETLIGGWRIETKEMLEDASFKKHLLTLYQNITA